MSASKKSKKTTRTLSSEAPLLAWIGALGIALFLLIFPYDRALFNGYEFSFDEPIYKAAIFALIMLLVAAGYSLRGWAFNSIRGLMSIAILLLPLMYWLASFQAVSSYYAKFMVLFAFLLAAFFLAGLFFGEHVHTRKVLEYGLIGSAYLIVLFGLLNLFGQIYYHHALWLAHDGYRLTSVFQYSNTYGAFLVAVFLISIYYTVHSTKRSAQLLHAFMLIPIWISFMLTYSRGAIVVLPVMIVIIMPFLRFSRQIAYIATAGVSIILSMLLLGKLSANSDAIAQIVQPTDTKEATTISLFSSLPLQSWALLLLGSAAMAGLAWLYHAKLAGWLEARTSKLAAYKWSFAAMPAAIVLITAAAGASLLGSSAVRSLLPDKLAERIANLNLQQHSVLERFTFYKDGLGFAQDYPIFGAGGGAWQAMFEQYQNNPYWSRQAHSYYVQLLVETGWLGLIVAIILLAAVYFFYIRSYIRYPERRGSHLVFFILSTALLMHSAIDFNMSYLYIGAIVFLSLGAMLSPFGKEAVKSKSKEQAPGTASVSKVRYIYPGAISLLTIVFLIIVIREQGAINKFNEAYTLASNPQTSLGQVIPILDKAISTSPKHTDFNIIRADWLEQGYNQSSDVLYLQQAIESLNAAKKHDPYNRGLLLATQRVLLKDGQIDANLELLDDGLEKFPWTIDIYEAAVTARFDAYTAAVNNGSSDEAQAHSDRIHAIYNELERRVEQLSSLPEEQKQGRAFSITENIQNVIDQLNNPS